MKTLILVLALLFAAPAMAEEKQTGQYTHIACFDYFKALELDSIIKTLNTTLIEMFINQEDGCIVMKEGVTYYVINDYKGLSYRFREVRLVANGEMYKAYMFGE